MDLLGLPVSLALFFLIALSEHFGWRVGRRRLQTLGENANDGQGAAEGAVFGMMGLLLAFTFTGAAARFDYRRELIVQETNAIGTAWLRLDLLQEGPREQARDLFRSYLDQRLDVYKDVTDRERTDKSLAEVAALQTRIWNLLMTQAHDDKSQPLPQALLPAVNDMFDISTSRFLATRQHPPVAIFLMLGALVVVSAFFVGFSQAKVTRQSLVHMLGFAAMTSLAMYLILDLEYPRLGFIRVDSFDQALIELRASMN